MCDRSAKILLEPNEVARAVAGATHNNASHVVSRFTEHEQHKAADFNSTAVGQSRSCSDLALGSDLGQLRTRRDVLLPHRRYLPCSLSTAGRMEARVDAAQGNSSVVPLVD
jgi:hypothetical protein